MSRPIYETAQDRRNERSIIDAVIALMWPDCTAVKIPYRYGIDFGIETLGGTPKAWIEAKRRNGSSQEYATYFVALGKWTAGLQLHRVTNLPFFIAFQWDDGLFIHEYQARLKQFYTLKMSDGRTRQTRDSGDIEPMIHIPCYLFDELGSRS